MDIKVKLKGCQTDENCSLTSGVGACEKLSNCSGNCLMFKQKLEYDWDTHSFKRCGQCLQNEIHN